MRPIAMPLNLMAVLRALPFRVHGTLLGRSSGRSDFHDSRKRTVTGTALKMGFEAFRMPKKGIFHFLIRVPWFIRGFRLLDYGARIRENGF